MKKFVKSTLVLVCICSVMAILLAVTNSVTAPIIQKNQDAAANEALLQVMPDGKDFEKIDLSTYKLPATITEAYKETNGGYVFNITTTGYSSGLVIMCGINADGTVSGALCLASTETLGHEKTFGDNFKDKNADEVSAVDTISGATKTTEAYKNAVTDALNAAIILGGGSVDLRTEEEILNDNLSAALPASDGKFTKLFIVEVIEGIDAIYKADNGKGYVCVVGETFIGVDETGKVISDVSADVATNIEAQLAIINATETTSIEVTDALKGVKSVSKTATGNYILEMQAAGYGITGGDKYHPASGEYIIIKVSMTKDGKIIDCITVSQAETEGVGDACADEKFYGQFDGMTKEELEDKKTITAEGKEKYKLDAISGATITGNAYANTLLRAFEAVKILEGGAN